MKTKDDIRAAVGEFILNHFPLARKREIGDDHSLLDGGIIDSLGILEVTTFMEEQFDITMSTEEMLAENFESIASIAEFVHNKLQADGSQWTS